MAFLRSTPAVANFRMSPATGDELTAQQELIVQAIDAGTYFRENEEPTGAVNDVNVTFTLAAAPSPAGSLQLYIDGIMKTGGGKDYSLSSATVTMQFPPATGSIIRCFYVVTP